MEIEMEQMEPRSLRGEEVENENEEAGKKEEKEEVVVEEEEKNIESQERGDV